MSIFRRGGGGGGGEGGGGGGEGGGGGGEGGGGGGGGGGWKLNPVTHGPAGDFSDPIEIEHSRVVLG